MKIIQKVFENYFYLLGVSLLACTLIFSACKKDSYNTSSQAFLYITADTLKYDTVFTTAGSVSKSFKIINNNDQKIKLSSIKLMGGSASSYKININGTAATSVANVDIPANDSIYIFVSVYINPSTANLPFLVSDSISINYNGNNKYVQLQAFGQNANFLQNRTITGNQVWASPLPYVILGSLRIDTTATLTIAPGCKIFLHANAPIIVDGTLITNGTKNNEIVFAGDRLDAPYVNYSGTWPGIYFRNKSKNNFLKFAIVKNATQAIVLENPSINTSPKLVLQQCIIDNALDAGILSTNSSLQANNSLISNCTNNINISYGGDYSFENCTVATYSNQYIYHKNPVLLIDNSTIIGSSVVTANLNANFKNCVFWGSDGIVTNEINLNKQGTTAFNVVFTKNIYKGSDPSYATISGNIKNTDPLFDSIDVAHQYFDFRCNKNSSSPSLNAGASTSFSKDLDDKIRSIGITDIGCYEKQ